MELRLDDTGFGGIEIFQNPQEFCYGVDAVLLADFASKPPSAAKEKSRIIDLGTGTGIVPLILSHKTKAGEIMGVEVQEAMRQIGAVVEGYYATHSAYRLAKQHGVEMPITEMAYDLLYNGEPASAAVGRLMQRQRTSETEDAAWAR